MLFNISLEKLDVTPEEFRQVTGIDLKERLNTSYMSGNPSNDVSTFINLCRLDINTYIDTYFNSTRGMIASYLPQPTDEQKFHYKMAVIEQIRYTLRNGEISTRSGLDENGNLTVAMQDLNQIAIAPNAKYHLLNCGINRQITTGGFALAWWWIL